MHGMGVFKLPDGRTYEGQYQDDKKHGSGVFIYPDGRRKEGVWQHGRFIKKKRQMAVTPS